MLTNHNWDIEMLLIYIAKPFKTSPVVDVGGAKIEQPVGPCVK